MLAERAWVTAAVSRHEVPLRAYVTRLTGDADRSRDIVQDAFVQLCQQPEAFVENVAPWLYSVCRNRAIDIARKEQRMTALSDCVAEPLTRERSVVETLEVQESTGTLMNQLDRLPALQQEAVRLKFQQQFSYREIAEVMGVTVSHVGVLLHEALKTLRTRMSGPLSPLPASGRGVGVRGNPLADCFANPVTARGRPSPPTPLPDAGRGEPVSDTTERQPCSPNPNSPRTP
ncbi:hypothetical protein BH11PLA2_BH11PLA2_49810 [soil metagenome]